MKKRKSANDYHQVREAVASGIASVVHIDTKFNLADMGTKSLNGQAHQFLLKNQHFPPVLTAGECESDSHDLDGKVGQARLFSSVLSPLDHDMTLAIADENFRSCACYLTDT